MGLMDKLFGTRSEREVKRLEPTVKRIEALEEKFSKLSGAELSVNGKKNCDLNADGNANNTDLQIALKLMAGIYKAADMPLK